MAPKERIEELREKLNEYNRLYYVENTPAVSDRQFDEMLRELQTGATISGVLRCQFAHPAGGQ